MKPSFALFNGRMTANRRQDNYATYQVAATATTPAVATCRGEFREARA